MDDETKGPLDRIEDKQDRLLAALANLASDFMQFKQHVTEEFDRLGKRTLHVERRTSSSQSMPAVQPDEGNGAPQ